jgi:hypothetical protein
MNGLNMSKDTLLRYQKYQAEIKEKLTNKVPSKHSSHPETYKAFLTKELRDVTSKIEALKLEGVVK